MTAQILPTKVDMYQNILKEVLKLPPQEMRKKSTEMEFELNWFNKFFDHKGGGIKISEKLEKELNIEQKRLNYQKKKKILTRFYES